MQQFSQAFSDGVTTLSETQSHFSARDVLRRTAEAAQGRGLDAEEIRAGIARELGASPRLIRLSEGPDARFAAKETFALESTLFEVADELRRNFSRG